ncbi:hypothetical protein LPJ63_004472 [Coemansia sp. RSA 2711]|nr:hypothetical protein LPJ63_004472 [Coemansia sp. RSA 2711]KAJ1842718.1 hypothetical protein LPJ70_003695 [Coemansia sp. RSA 2708]KAJ2322190.1 hypothetical protein IWW52_000245 [Coemansia sp. RSA 2704]KAJ2366149.1 hypothetical protein H4S01_002869 [Coemansia sp. RSA 2610]KAJ2388893.1 hypothetical protein H4S02_002641 [Coemansia sp. RSA 2611]KAJ2717736.1 hypothetical protein H4R23_005220 [Coemansia sp. Cherry 401B]
MMRLFAGILLVAGIVAGSVQEDKDAIAEIARQVIPTKNSDLYTGAFQQLAVVLGDEKAVAGLRGNPTSSEFQGGLRSLLADVDRAMWVFNDDKPTLDYLQMIAKRIKIALS